MPETFFSEQEQETIIEAIRSAEAQTNGEIRVHLEATCSGDAYQEAVDWFGKLGMHETDARNGVLIFVAYQDHKLAIVGDKGIHEKVGDNFWQAEKDLMVEYFKQGKYTEGLCLAIRDVGEKLQSYFPKTKNNPNELSDDLSFGKPEGGSDD